MANEDYRDGLELDSIEVSDSAIANAVQIAALAVPGVTSLNLRLYDEVVDEISERLGQKVVRGINVKRNKSGTEITIYLILAYDTHIPTVAKEVRLKIREAIESLFDIKDAKINVHIEGLSYEQGATQNEA